MTGLINILRCCSNRIENIEPHRSGITIVVYVLYLCAYDPRWFKKIIAIARFSHFCYFAFQFQDQIVSSIMFTLENEHLRIDINSKGAELNSLYNKKFQLEYMWSGDPAFWNKKSPVLFPIVGTLKGNTFYFNENTYHLSRHGFAREMEFALTSQTDSSITLSLEDTAGTLEVFPFHFRFDIGYSILGDKLYVLYRVINRDNGPIYFSVGGHPAFKVPLEAGCKYGDYFLEFAEPENAGRWPISGDGLIEQTPLSLLKNERRILLSKELFYEDALVFKNLHSTKVQLLNSRSQRGLEFDFTGFPFLGIWAAKNADFVCIEPWCGIADSVNGNQHLQDKEGIVRLNTSEQFERTWSVRCF